MKKTVTIIVLSSVFGFFGAFVYQKMNPVERYHSVDSLSFSRTVSQPEENGENKHLPAAASLKSIPENTDFVAASASATQSVVYIKNISKRRYATSWMDLYFNGQGNTQTQVSSGSGVIFSADGYIVTNNHVIADADKIEVIHQRSTYEAELIGTDPNTDLAVLKIKNANLPAVTIGSSNTLKVGEWVIAVGNPFNLNSTVTAGIVSAKGRSINILRSKFPIESFIQTDAAINPGNSGGALVNSKGELVGINTAILSKTGSYAGYGFAVPIDIVKKVVKDLIDYGEVQKAFFGGEVTDLTSEVANRLDIKVDKRNIKGVLLAYLQSDGSAAKAGMKEGDIILAVDNVTVDSKAAFDEILSYHSPGEKIKILYQRNGKTANSSLTLTNREGTTGVLKREIYSSNELGADFEALSKVEKDRLGISEGIRVFNIKRGLINDLGLREDNIIVSLNNKKIQDPQKFVNALTNLRGSVHLGWINSRGRYENYSFYLR